MRFGARSSAPANWVISTVLMACLLVPAGITFGQAKDDVSVGDMTPRQRLSYAEDSVSEIRAGTRKVLKMVEQAQRDKDVLLLNCLNEKLAGLKALLNVVEQADLAMQEALARENNDLATHEFQKIVIARQQAQQLLAEAEACVPEVGTSYAGTGRWATTGPDDQEDDSLYDSEVGGYERPPEASPFN